MSDEGYEEYRSRQWKVTENGELAPCRAGDTVTFGESPDDVKVTCEKVEHYGAGKYDRASHTIKSKTANEYEISMTAGTRRTISFQPGSASIMGSWTAEDQGSGPAGE